MVTPVVGSPAMLGLTAKGECLLLPMVCSSIGVGKIVVDSGLVVGGRCLPSSAILFVARVSVLSHVLAFVVGVVVICLD